MRSTGLIIATTATLLAVAGAVNAAWGAASSSHSRAVQAAAVRKAWGKLDSAFYFGSAAAICDRMTQADRRAFARAWAARRCIAAARTEEHASRTCPSTGGYTPAQWRAAVRFKVAHLRVTILSATRARTVDPELIAQTLVKSNGRWLFAHGWPTVQC